MAEAAKDLLDDESLLPGDVVVDGANHRPLLVTGYDTRPARDVPEVWQSDVNQHHLGIGPEETVLETVALPRGNRYYVPTEVEPFPERRLDRIPTEPATNDRRVQQKVVRSVLANLMVAARDNENGIPVDALGTLIRQQFGSRYAGEVEEFADAIEAGQGAAHE
jgi:hypothetical protein